VAGRDRWVTIVEVVLLLNAVVAFAVLSSVPGKTETLFVWTVKPEASVRLLAAMYGNAALLAVFALRRPDWSRARVGFVVFAPFSLAATIVTFFHLGPFLAHPRYFFIYWLVNYFFLFFATPLVFATRERRSGGRLPVRRPLGWSARAATAFAALACLFGGVALLIGPDFVNRIWPWSLTPLVARIIGVWLTSLGAAFAWALWDGDASRARLIHLQALPTAVLLGLIPVVERADLSDGAGRLVLYAVIVGALALVGLVGLVPRPREEESRGAKKGRADPQR
jgi:hypothetical protein